MPEAKLQTRPPARVSPTFRDPAGSLHLSADSALRTIHAKARDEVEAFLGSPLRERLERRGQMCASEVVDPGREALQLRHPRIAVPTYPWEWTPGQWLAAAELTLTLCEEALPQGPQDEGWILKDATPLNILFVGARPVLVDVLSFERYAAGSSIWLAYGQYVRTFLLPLLMYRLLRWPLALSLYKRDGYEPGALFGALGWWQRLRPGAFFAITLPVLLEKQNGGGAASGLQRLREPEVAVHILRSHLKGLRRRTRAALPRAMRSEWSEYTAQLKHYTEQESAQKVEFVREVLEALHPRRVLDIGANTGEFSVLAAGTGASVVALERDEAAAEKIFQRAQAQGLDVLTICADLARPTPAVGWENAESLPLLERLEGQSELVLMLAVIHHLLLMEQIPLSRIMELMRRLATGHLVLEWVPVTDPMYRSLVRGREELYGSLNESDLLEACRGLFAVVRREELENGRVLLLLRAEPEGEV